MRLSDTIESFIKDMLASDQEGVELKRNEMAQYFHCAPSQINYVLATRFTQDHGYVIESRRGGGGCIRIVRVMASERDPLDFLIKERIGDSLDVQSAQMLLNQLVERGAITQKDAGLMRAAISTQALGVPAPEGIKNALRARIFRAMLLSLVQTQKAQSTNNPEQMEG